jgi:hypothetical protein
LSIWTTIAWWSRLSRSAFEKPHAYRESEKIAAQRLAQIDRQITAINAALKASLAKNLDPKLASMFSRLYPASVRRQTHRMSELGTLDNKQVASLASLAPVAHDSRQYRGKVPHSQRTRKPKTNTLYARTRRDALQFRYESEVQSSRRNRAFSQS